MEHAKNRRRGGSQAGSSATGETHDGSSSQSEPSQHAPPPLPPATELGNLQLGAQDQEGARQVVPAPNQSWPRVGQRELGAILEPHFLDRIDSTTSGRSSPSSPSATSEAETEVEEEQQAAPPHTPNRRFKHSGQNRANKEKFNANSNNNNNRPGTPTISSEGKRLSAGYALGPSTATPDRRLSFISNSSSARPRSKSTTAATSRPRLRNTPREKRARARELARRLAAEERAELESAGYGTGRRRRGSRSGNDYGRRRRSSNSFGHRHHHRADMASQQSKWREELVLVICPGSQTTLAQLGCNELTPPTHRFPTRMFKDPSGDGYRPFHTHRRKKATITTSVNGSGAATSVNEAAAAAADAANAKPDEYEDIEDPDNTEGGIYPLEGGRIVNTDAFLAFLDHVHSTLTKTNHNTPIVIMASPQWTRGDCETITRYIFEKTKTPALSLLHSAVAAQYGLRHQTMTVVDIGFEKVDVTCIHDNLVVSHKGLGFPNPEREISGGEVFTQKLLSLLKDKGFTYDMAEQLKKSPLCEVLPYAPDLPDLMELPTDADAPQILEPTAAIADAEDMNVEAKEGEEGVLDVANIVTSGNTREFLAKKEKEKAEKAKSKKGKGQEAETAAAKLVRLPNSKKKFAIFHYEELVHEDVQVPVQNGAPKTKEANPNPIPKPPPNPANGGAPPAEAAAAAAPSSTEEVKPEQANGDAAQPPPAAATTAAPAAAATTEQPTSFVTERRTKRVRKDIEVGLERFLFADRGEIDRIVTTIYRAVQGIDEPYKRPACWDNIIFVGNGSRLRGLRENILQTLNARHLIFPSTATIFTSELPSNMATPSGTGSQTPTGSYTGGGSGPVPITTSSVNPLLQAATTASSLGVPGQVQAPGSTTGDPAAAATGGGGGGHHHHHAHGQTPTSIKLASLPTYLAEWTKNGFEEAMFLGALVFGRLTFCHNIDPEAQRMMSLTRVDYNELGPKAIRTHSSTLW